MILENCGVQFLNTSTEQKYPKNKKNDLTMRQKKHLQHINDNSINLNIKL